MVLNPLQSIGQGFRKNRGQKVYVELQVSAPIQPVQREQTAPVIVGGHQAEGQTPRWDCFFAEVATRPLPAEVHLFIGDDLENLRVSQPVRGPQQPQFECIKIIAVECGFKNSAKLVEIGCDSKFLNGAANCEVVNEN